MTTIAASPLSETLQALVDARLDTIDRMLLGRVNRADRLAIVREVETQVFDLLARHDGGSIDRDDVLAVLAQLDPPEAYLPEEGESIGGPRHAPRPAAARPAASPSASRLPLTAGVLGIISVVLVLLAYPMAIGLQSEVILVGLPLLAALGSLLAIVFAGMTRLRGAWSLTGLITGIVTMTIFLAMGTFVLLNGI
jgi:hypothetical protein